MKPVEWFPQSFRETANSLMIRYGAPVYLVGGALTDSDHVRDFDIRIILPNVEMQRLYGGDFPNRGEDWGPWQWRRVRDCLKQSRGLGNWGGVPIDFQVQSYAEASLYDGKTKLRLDTAPDWAWRL